MRRFCWFLVGNAILGCSFICFWLVMPSWVEILLNIRRKFVSEAKCCLQMPSLVEILLNIRRTFGSGLKCCLKMPSLVEILLSIHRTFGSGSKFLPNIYRGFSWTKIFTKYLSGIQFRIEFLVIFGRLIARHENCTRAKHADWLTLYYLQFSNRFKIQRFLLSVFLLLTIGFICFTLSVFLL
jgi:hypothetical protein